MKNLVPFLLFSSGTFAQITISNSDFTPIGRNFFMAFDTISQLPGSAGANQIWNFSNLQSPFLDTIFVNHPDSTPFANYFPSANVSFSSPSSTYYQYFDNTNTGFYLLGIVLVTTPNPPSSSTYIPSSKYFKWPMNYSDSFIDSCINISIYPSIGPNGTDTSKYSSHYKEQNLVDAWGKITTPMGTFDCLRQKKIQSRIDSAWYFSALAGTWSLVNTFTDTTILYDWVSNDAATGFLVAEINFNQTSNTYSGVYWMKNSIAGIPDYDYYQTISFYPNPASGILCLQVERAGVLELHDLKGRTLLQQNINAGFQRVDVEALPAGFYLLTIKDTKGNFVSAKAKIIIEK